MSRSEAAAVRVIETRWLVMVVRDEGRRPRDEQRLFYYYFIWRFKKKKRLDDKMVTLHSLPNLRI
jgi:hypothetical protein